MLEEILRVARLDAIDSPEVFWFYNYIVVGIRVEGGWGGIFSACEVNEGWS